MDSTRLAEALAPLATPAGVLTLSRLPLAVVFPLVAVHGPGPALGIYLLGVSTDFLDGWLARRSGQTSQLGAYLDGIADKTFHLSVAGTLWWLGWVPEPWLLLWFTREILQGVLAPWFALRILQAPGRSRGASRLGKAATVALGIAVVAVILGWMPGALAASIATAALGAAATLGYLRRERRPRRTP